MEVILREQKYFLHPMLTLSGSFISKFIVLASLMLININILFSQGLEDIITETYYITDLNDAKGAGSNHIPAGWVTYRVYVDMKPGYVLQSVYGSPGHELKLSTSTAFYNHPLYGNYIPNLVMDPVISGGALMLDSWIGVGAATQQTYGVLKEEDDTLKTVVNVSKPQMLQGEHMLAGVPLKKKDGLFKPLEGLPPRVTQIGIDSLLVALDKVKAPESGYVFSTENGGWGCLGGAAGPFPETNRVLIGQFTTNGDFYFEFNIQIGSAEHGVEQYVARNPLSGERLHPGLIISKQSLKSR
jgi:hypothetical protein